MPINTRYVLKMLSSRWLAALLLGACIVGPVVVYAQIPGHTTITLNRDVRVSGDLNVTGALSKGSGSFLIDHPLDPKNKLLYHSFVESPDVKNLYDGVAILDSSGTATIELPSYFLALNTDFRYLASALYQPMPNLHLGQGVHRKYLNLFGTIVFTIEGGAPGGTISWQVTGIRHDPYILANPLVPEVDKTDETPFKKGECVLPELCL